MNRLLYILCFVLLANTMVFSQSSIKQFSPDSIKFLEEMSIFLEESRKKEGKDFIEEFEAVWWGGVFTERQRQRVYKTTNLMLEKKLRPFPDFKSYLYSLMSFSQSDQSQESFDSWQESIEKLIEGRRKKNLTDYLEFCNNLFTDRALYKSASTTWTASNDNYEFQFDEEPYLTFNALDLVCYSKKDSAVIESTKGIYYPLDEKWNGDGGKVTWERAGFDSDEVYAVLKKYEISTKSPSYKADSVVFYNYVYFDKPHIGRIEEKVLANVVAEKASYPRFDSYSKRIQIENIFDKVDYEGGFAQYGVKFVGKGNEDKDAFVTIKKEGEPFMILSSKAFSIRPDRIISDRASVKILMEHETKDGMKLDSITHPGLKFKYLNETRLVELLRTDEGINKSPYFNTFHNIDMYFELLTWNIDDPFLKMQPLTGSSDRSAVFESDFFFKEYKFDRLQGISRTHPLFVLKNKCFEGDISKQMYVEEIAQCIGLSPTQTKVLLMTLATQGFLYYDFDNDLVIPKDKLFHYVFAKSKKEDYDVIQFQSDTKGSEAPNAQMSLLNYDLDMYGVKRVFLSDSQNVAIFPLGQQLVLKENRDFNVTGIVNAGRLQFYGKEFVFEYNDFRLDMPNIDSVKFKAVSRTADEYGKKKLVWVKTVVENMKGELFIDNPGNKAGIKEGYEDYPIFKSLKKSYAYYQRKNILGGVYKKEDFYFELEPFEFDSLDDFGNDQIRFDGRFVSAGIFPEFEEKLVLMPDYSLGFSRNTPESGFPVYGGKGLYNAEINLSHKGLRGDGSLNYVTSIAESNDFVFFPDSMNCIAQNYVIEEQPTGIEFPPATGKNVKIHWEPNNDFMNIKSTDAPIAMYDGSTLNGDLTLNPKELTGGGLFAFEDAEMESKLYKFKFSEFNSDTCDFRLKSSTNVGGLAFKTKNFNAHIDFKERKGEFKSNGGGSFIDFPENQYIAYMDKFTWFMDDDNIELSADTKVQSGADDLQLEGSKFISMHPDQDSLTFFAPAAKYDLKSSKITAKGVKFMNIADAMIYPDSGKVIVEKQAVMQPLKNARILANFITQYHNIYNATANILARRNYTASGEYDYVDENKLKQKIVFDKIAVDTTYQSYGTGVITEDAGFTLSPAFEYRGDVKFEAKNPNLVFSGATRIHHDCSGLEKNWLKFEAKIDPLELYIPLDTFPTTVEGKILASGDLMGNDSLGVYGTFLTEKARRSDQLMVQPYGFLYYDKSDKEYQIAKKDKLDAFELPGNFIALRTEDCLLYSEGEINLGTDLGQLKLQPVGNINHTLIDNKVELDVMMLVDFFFVDQAFKSMADNFKEYDEADPIDFERKIYEKGLQDLIGTEEADKLISDINLYGEFKKFPSELNKRMFITKLKLEWNREEGAYRSIGKIGLGNIEKEQLNKLYNGYIEIIKKRSGDIFTMYIELDPSRWYFFTYQRNVLQAISSDEDFNTAIKETKPDKRKYNNQKGEAPFSFLYSTERKKRDFLRKFEGEE